MSTVDLRETKPVVDMSGIAKTYPGPPPVTALNDATLCISEGEYVTIVGASGSGKSTLLNIIGLLDVPTAGNYTLAGTPTPSLSDRQRTSLRASKIGFVFQAFHLMPHRTTTENVVLAMLYTGVKPHERRERAHQALTEVGLQHRLKAPAGLLSGGEKQRAAIARALVNQPSLLLCDEPTGNLDSRSAGRILDILDQLSESGVTIAVITHDQAVAKRGSRQVEIVDGVLSNRA